jgi:hypothetical protein
MAFEGFERQEAYCDWIWYVEALNEVKNSQPASLYW